jgi:NAD-dependent DNA ligase
MPNQNIVAELTKICETLETANRSYYDHNGQVNITDDVYDALWDELDHLRTVLYLSDPKHELVARADKVLSSVGATPVSGSWPKKAHSIPMLSLKKVKGLSGIEEWFSKMEQQVSG